MMHYNSNAAFIDRTGIEKSPGNSHTKKGGCSSEILERNPTRYRDPVLWAWLEMLFTPKTKEVPTLKQHVMCSHVLFGSIPLKVSKKLPLLNMCCLC